MTNRQRAVGSGLHYHVVVSDGAKCTTDLRLPDAGRRSTYPSISSTPDLHGRRDAVCRGPAADSRALTAQVAAEIEGSGVRLLHVYLTQGHPDHWFGTATLLERFGDADTKVYAGKGTIAQVAEQLGASDNELTRAFPGQIPERISVSIEPVPADGLTLEGHLEAAVGGHRSHRHRRHHGPARAIPRPGGGGRCGPQRRAPDVG